jgi:hypothetical protein
MAIDNLTTFDVSIEPHDEGGTLFYAATDRAREWFHENVDTRPFQWDRGSLIVAGDFATPIIEALEKSGLVVVTSDD